MPPFLSWNFILVVLGVVLVNAAALALGFRNIPSPAGFASPQREWAFRCCAWILHPVQVWAYDRAEGQFRESRVAIVLIWEAVVIHLIAGFLSCTWKGKPLKLSNLFRFRAKELQFSARQLLVFMTLVCVIGGVYAGWRSWQRRAEVRLRALLDMGINCDDGSGYDFQGYYGYIDGGKKVRFAAAAYQDWRSRRGAAAAWDFPPELLRIKNVTQLSIFSAHLPPEIGRFTDVQVLNLEYGGLWSDGRLTTLPSEIGNLSDLRVLVLRNNALTVLPPEIGRLTKLEMLDLRGNPITDSVVEQLAPLRNLRMVFREDTEMTEAGIAKLRQTLPNCNVE